MVRRNPYKMKKKDGRTRREEILKARKGKKKRETYADSMPGVVFSFAPNSQFESGNVRG